MAGEHREHQREPVAVDARSRCGAGARSRSGRPAPGPRPAAAGSPPSSRGSPSPAPGWASPTKRAEASATSTRPPSRISNTPISLVAPKRFLSARTVRKVRSRSPSKWSTQSTRCSSARGPASDPSLVTWPIRSMVTSRRLATLHQRPRSPRAPRRRFPGVASPDGQGLDRVDHADGGALGLDRGQHRLQRGLGEDRDVERRVAEPLGPASGSGPPTPRPRRRASCARRAERSPAPSRPACSCRSRARRRAGPASPGPGRRRAPGRARRSRSAAAPSARPRRRAAASASRRPPADARRSAPPPPRAAPPRCSSVFQAPQPGHCPVQARATCPHSEQTCCDPRLRHRTILASEPDATGARRCAESVLRFAAGWGLGQALRRLTLAIVCVARGCPLRRRAHSTRALEAHELRQDHRSALAYARARPEFQTRLQQQNVQDAIDFPLLLRERPRAQPARNICANRKNECAGDVRFYDWDETTATGSRRRSCSPARSGAVISGTRLGHTRPAPPQRPAVVITTGSVQAPETLYWGLAATLAKAGYVVLTYDVQGQGQSDTLGEAPDTQEGVPSQAGPALLRRHRGRARLPALDARARPTTRARAAGTRTAASAPITRPSTTAASAQGWTRPSTRCTTSSTRRGSGSPATRSAPPRSRSSARRTRAWTPSSAGTTCATPTTGDAGDGADGVPECPSAARVPRRARRTPKPALGMSADYGHRRRPRTRSDPDPQEKNAAFARVQGGGRRLDAGEHPRRDATTSSRCIPGITVPVPRPASLRGQDMTAWYTQAWLDKYVRCQGACTPRAGGRRRAAADRPLAERPRHAGDRPELPTDPNMYFSFYFRSRYDFGLAAGGDAVCDDMRTGCATMGADGGPPEFSYVDYARTPDTGPAPGRVPTRTGTGSPTSDSCPSLRDGADGCPARRRQDQPDRRSPSVAQPAARSCATVHARSAAPGGATADRHAEADAIVGQRGRDRLNGGPGRTASTAVPGATASTRVTASATR